MFNIYPLNPSGALVHINFKQYVTIDRKLKKNPVQASMHVVIAVVYGDKTWHANSMTSRKNKLEENGTVLM